MPRQYNAEVHILDRVMWLLEEGSVRYAVAHDEAFAVFVEQLYATVYQKATALRNR